MQPKAQFVLSAILVEFDLQALCREAQLIIRCRVTEAAFRSSVSSIEALPPFKESPSLLVVFTDHRVEVEEVLKPSNFFYESELVVRTLGGETPGLSGYANGEAHISPGEHLILFLSRDHAASPALRHDPFPEDPLTFTVFGGFQGKFIILDRENGEPFVKRLEQPESAFVELAKFRQQILDSLPGTALSWGGASG